MYYYWLFFRRCRTCWSNTPTNWKKRKQVKVSKYLNTEWKLHEKFKVFTYVVWSFILYLSFLSSLLFLVSFFICLCFFSLTYSIIIRQITLISLTIIIASISSHILQTQKNYTQSHSFFLRPQFICRIWMCLIGSTHHVMIVRCLRCVRDYESMSVCVCVCLPAELLVKIIWLFSKASQINKEKGAYIYARTHERTHTRVHGSKTVSIDYIKIHMNLFYYKNERCLKCLWPHRNLNLNSLKIYDA